MLVSCTPLSKDNFEVLDSARPRLSQGVVLRPSGCEEAVGSSGSVGSAAVGRHSAKVKLSMENDQQSDTYCSSNRASTVYRAVNVTPWIDALRPQDKLLLGRLEEWYCMTCKSPVHRLGVDHMETGCELLLVETTSKKRAPKLSKNLPGTYINAVKEVEMEVKALARERRERLLKQKREKRLLEALPVGEVIINLEMVHDE